jgi:hypothetical protein
MFDTESEEVPEAGEPPAPTVTASGFPRRVRGAQAPRTEVVPAYREPATDAAGSPTHG